MVAGLCTELQEIRFEQMLPWAIKRWLGDTLACTQVPMKFVRHQHKPDLDHLYLICI